MRKKQRIFKKQEKRIVKLLYRKGIISIDLKDVHWIEYFRENAQLHLFTRDYWGEYNDYSIVKGIQESIFWCHDDDEDAVFRDVKIPVTKINLQDRVKFIRFLSKLKTINHDSSINKVLSYKNFV